MLFKCDWYDTTPDIGVKVHKQYKLVEVNKNRRYAKYEPFILAMQAEQVCYMPSPTLNNNSDWLSVFKVKPRGWTDTRPSGQNKEAAFQEEAVVSNDIMATSEEDHYEYMASDGSDNEDENDEQTQIDDDDHDGIAERVYEFEYSTEEDEEEPEDEEDND